MKIRRRTHILFIALIIVIVFTGSLKNDFAWDDKYLIVDNAYVKSWDYLPEIFVTQLYEGGQKHSNFYRPIQLLSFTLDYLIWGLNPFGYHLVNLFLHIFNSALVYFILIAVGASSGLALLSTILFGVSPAISGITYYISARSDLLMAMFIFLSFLFFAKYIKYSSPQINMAIKSQYRFKTLCNKTKAFYVLSLIFFILALLSKEMAVMLIFLLAILIFNLRDKTKARWKLLLPYIIVLVFYLGLRTTILNFAIGRNPLIDFNYPAGIPLWRRILTDFKIIPVYLRILLLPYGLHMDWFIKPVKTIFQIDLISCIALLIFLIYIVKKISHVNNLALFGASWFLLSLLPVLNIYPISVFFGEGWLYVPSVGFFVIFSIILRDIIRSRIGKALGNGLILFFIIYFSLFTISYGKVWKDSISVFQNVLKYEEDSPFIYLTYNNIGMAHYDNGEFEKSIKYIKKSILSNPGYQDAYNNLGVTYMTIGRPIKAIRYFKKAISLKRDDAFTYRNLAHAYSDIGLKDRAISFSRIALNLDPDSYKTYCNLGYIFSDKGDEEKAIEFFRKSSKIAKGSYEPHYALGNLYLRRNRFKEALDEYEIALRLGLRDYMFYNELAFLYIKNNKFKEAEDALMQSLALNSNQAEPHNHLGNLYSMFGYFELAIKEYRKALEIAPDNMGIQKNLKKTKIDWKDAIKR